MKKRLRKKHKKAAVAQRKSMGGVPAPEHLVPHTRRPSGTLSCVVGAASAVCGAVTSPSRVRALSAFCVPPSASRRVAAAAGVKKMWALRLTAPWDGRAVSGSAPGSSLVVAPDGGVAIFDSDSDASMYCATREWHVSSSVVLMADVLAGRVHSSVTPPRPPPVDVGVAAAAAVEQGADAGATAGGAQLVPPVSPVQLPKDSVASDGHPTLTVDVDAALSADTPKSNMPRCAAAGCAAAAAAAAVACACRGAPLTSLLLVVICVFAALCRGPRTCTSCPCRWRSSATSSSRTAARP